MTWTKLGVLPNSWGVFGSVIEGSDGALYVVSHSVCDQNDSVYASKDRGMTWSTIAMSPTFGVSDPDFGYYFAIRSIMEVAGKVLVVGNAPMIFRTQ